jgi:hypothetical protein
MTFDKLLERVLAMLQRRGRVPYQALKRQVDLDGAYLKDVKADIVEVHQVAVDQDDIMLVWTGALVPTTTSPLRTPPQAHPPCPTTRLIAHHSC